MLDTIANLWNKLKSIADTEVFTLFDVSFSVGELLIVPLVVLVGLWATKALAKTLASKLTSRGANPNSVLLIRRVFYVVAIILLVITTLDILNIPITAFAFLSGAVAIGVGFGAQNIINNFISGWILMWEKPIKIGDFLEVDGARGKVETINTRSTRIRRVDGVHMLIPNSKLLENTVINWTLIDTLTRTSVRVGVAYGSPCRKVSELIEQATNEHEQILGIPKPVVIFDDFGDNSLAFEVYFWVNATVERDLRIIRSDIRFRIDELFAQNHIVIAFPQRDVHIDGAIRLERSQAQKPQ
ncbi:mechanosensitive ion channel family protein [Alteromonas oceanisediminis]|uniref:mechanosensitive ion channel family protein n=1 Tax=Alteromonas oceanisediminis TaxID=2836180 RepID=UPI001BDB634D|nr:mechanosensitive ion channel domain-containing protein [Alteromonas oceanisediminis]MBT0586462.1 mechanosensitive ion channel [Alteromonas oceanisediminis]